MSTEDVFSSSFNAVVDCDVLEAAKENIQPLASGRRVTSLSSVLATPYAQRESKLVATRHRLRINVEMALEDEDDDPLEAYCILVNWTLENYPQGHSAESGLLELLEEATRVLKEDRGGKWRKEMKYLKLWMLYASFVEKPTIIYRFLLANDIGVELAILYEEYAAILERDGRRKEADDVYCLGIARKASPLDHLKGRYTDFQKRMMSSALPQIDAAPAGPITSTTRRALASTASTPAAPLPSIPAQTRLHNAPNAPLRIFVDPSGSAAQSAEMEMNAWPDIGTRKTRVKENIPETKKLAGTTLKQAGKTKRLASGSSGSTIVPYRDPGPDEMPPPPPPFVSTTSRPPSTPKGSSFTPFVEPDSKPTTAPSTPRFTPFRDESTITSPFPSAPGSIMKPKKADVQSPTSEAEALRKDPLKNYDTTPGQ
ncbi:Mad3/BUB1 homology region 1-domain-containing protein [Rhodocollybia butyracea]|uniref:Mad3/BUB1 homology region 1-domain-containing protein n=1 Tax=Rhodocollybia butyracea TaxID=206335 RepID=A0A9P5QAK4_9AGAR|nr:Mad3/BUB1 homology region 1-domain-containing protein [Rhodocollybia butyracea]